MLKVNSLSLKYDNTTIIDDITFNVEKRSITTIIGPNGCGKSTLLKALSKNKKINKGSIVINSTNIEQASPKALAKKVSILPQNPIVPNDFTARDLVEYGRYPHLGWTGRLKKHDYEIIDWAIRKVRIEHLQHRKVMTMSGGERQRAWIAMALAQQPEFLLLDEPTTYLDICYQFEVLELVKKLNKSINLTIIMVLHDLNQAARYSDKIIIIDKGKIYNEGSPQETITKKALEEVFNLKVKILNDTENNCPFFIPLSSNLGYYDDCIKDSETKQEVEKYSKLTKKAI